MLLLASERCARLGLRGGVKLGVSMRYAPLRTCLAGWFFYMFVVVLRYRLLGGAPLVVSMGVAALTRLLAGCCFWSLRGVPCWGSVAG